MTEPRLLRSKQLRTTLWLAADGHCQRCGVPLGTDWQADHITPWVTTGRTNVHEMQALCADCNRKKGAMGLRGFQHEFQQRIREIKANAPGARWIVAEVWPGGGKSVLPVITASELVGSGIDAICWVVPRENLRVQGEGQFLDGTFRRILNHRLEIRQSTNDIDPTRGLAGFVTTYQAIVSDNSVLVHEFARQRYALILDEPHHVERDPGDNDRKGGEWHRALQPLVERAELVIQMSGTLERGDGKPIAWLPYRPRLGGEELDLRPTPDRRIVQYGLTDALRERAVVPIYFHLIDFKGKWDAGDGSDREVESFDDVLREDRSGALWTALHTDYAKDVLRRCTIDWLAHRESVPGAKLLAIAPTQARARQYLTYLRAGGARRVDVAISEDSKAAKDAIGRFRLRQADSDALDALVTVGMAYEGLDIKSISHVACLTHFRSRPWLIQAVNRCNRVDPEAGPWEQQWGVVYGPRDAAFLKVVEEFDKWQLPFIKDRMKGPPGPGPDPRSVVPWQGMENGQVLVTNPVDDEILDTADVRHLESAARAVGLNAPLITLQRFKEAYSQPAVAEAMVPLVDQQLTPSEREKRLRTSIQEECNKLDWHLLLEHGTMNTRLVRKFRKSRTEMREAELQACWQWIVEQWDAYLKPV